MLYIGPTSTKPDVNQQNANAATRKATEAVTRTVTRIAQPKTTQPTNDPTDILADTPSYILLPNLREIFDNPESAMKKGQFQHIHADAIDLPHPRDTPKPEHANLWIPRLPEPFADIFERQYNAFFLLPLSIYVKTARQSGTLPIPRIHAPPRQYPLLLQRAQKAGMLRWSIVSEEDNDYTELASAIQLTLFAVSKSAVSSRLISWPRVLNDALPDPPYTSLPDPSLFEAIEVIGSNPSAFGIDVKNMFHNITLPVWLTRLFPMKPIHTTELDSCTINEIKKQLPNLRENENQLLRPCQATMPMGFKWAVFIAHSFVSGCIDTAYSLFRNSRFAPPELEDPHTLHAERAPFTVSRTRPLTLHIIDDITLVAIDWADDAVNAWHRIARRVLELNRLPINEKKSSRPGSVDKFEIDFIGCRWDFQTMIITSSSDKLSKAIHHCNTLIGAGAVSSHEWQRTIGKLIWIATLNRPLLSCLQRVFASERDDTRRAVSIKDTWKKELRTLFPLLPMAAVHLNMDISPILFAFDASLQAGAVTKTVVGPALARSLWNRAQAARCSKALPSNQEMPIVKLIAKTYKWKKVLAHNWAKQEHINGLEAAAAVLALEAAIRAGVHNQKLVLLTDSLVVLGALQKGRSSSPAILVRCRRFAALALAHNIKVILVYVQSANNPADEHTRE